MFVIGLQLREWCIYGVGGPIGLWFGWENFRGGKLFIGQWNLINE